MTTDKQQRKSGTREWAKVNKNLVFGCSHDCLYCYARANALRFRKINTADEWKNMRLSSHLASRHKYDGRIMFPTSHDIFIEHIESTVSALKTWLTAGNDILIVSKPHLEVIKTLCSELTEHKQQIVFRFTIGSLNDDVLKFWEPGAPAYGERLESLRYAYESGYQTSVSCEPFLDRDIDQLVIGLRPFVTDVIWIGKMNNINQRVNMEGWTKADFFYLSRVKSAQTDEAIKELYERFQSYPNIRWKDSIKKVIGLPEEAIG